MIRSAHSTTRVAAALGAALFLAFLGVTARPALAQQRPDPATLLAAERQALARLSFMDGIWRGAAANILPSGQKHEITQTERVGPFLGGAVRVMEGRGYEADGKVAFNAFGTISFDPATKKYTMHSYALGNVGDFALTPTDDGFTWEIPRESATIRYTATFHDGTWEEVGDRIVPGQDPVCFFEMTLQRVGDTDWPAAGAVGPN
jgi:hypothetical protein